MRFWKIWETVSYICLILLIVGQITIGFDFWVGQVAYLIADIGLTIRSFAINQEKSDKVKNTILLAICIGVMIIKIL